MSFGKLITFLEKNENKKRSKIPIFYCFLKFNFLKNVIGCRKMVFFKMIYDISFGEETAMAKYENLKDYLR